MIKFFVGWYTVRLKNAIWQQINSNFKFIFNNIELKINIINFMFNKVDFFEIL